MQKLSYGSTEAMIQQVLLDVGLNIFPAKNLKNISGLSPEERTLIKTEEDLARAISKKNRKARGRIYNCLHEMDSRRFMVLLRLIDKRVISENGVLAVNLINSFVEHGKAKLLFELLYNSSFSDTKDEKEGDRFLVTTLHWLGSNLNFSSSLIKAAMKDKEVADAISFLVFYCLKHGLGFKTAPAGTYHFPWIGQPDCSDRCFAWPLNQTHSQWVEERILPIRAKCKAEDEYLDSIWNLQPNWGIVDRLWHRLEAEAIYCLHLDGDHIRFNLPEMEIFRLTGVTLKNGLRFPGAEVCIHSETFGTKQEIVGKLIDGRLDFAEYYWCEYAQWYITLAVIIGYFQVVTGQDPDKDPWYTKCQTGKKCKELIERRPAKPHFYSLQPGHKASDEAKANCLYYFGRQLAPGKTFRVGKKMVVVTKQRISTTVTPQGLLRHMAD